MDAIDQEEQFPPEARMLMYGSNSTPSWWSWRLPPPVLYTWTAVTVGWSHCTRHMSSLTTGSDDGWRGHSRTYCQNHIGSSRSVGQGFVPSGTHKAWLQMPQASLQLKPRLGNFALLSGLSMYLQCFQGMSPRQTPHCRCRWIPLHTPTHTSPSIQWEISRIQQMEVR